MSGVRPDASVSSNTVLPTLSHIVLRTAEEVLLHAK